MKRVLKHTLIGAFWSGLFLGLLRTFMIARWNFDPLRGDHWVYGWQLWINGWMVDTLYEWSFIITLLAVFPLWLTGWALCEEVNWSKHIDQWANKLSFVKKVIPVQTAEEVVAPVAEVSTTVRKPHPLHAVSRVHTISETKHTKPEELPPPVPKPEQPPHGDSKSLPSALPGRSSVNLSEPLLSPSKPVSEDKSVSSTEVSAVRPKLGPPPPVIFDRILSRAGYKVIPDVVLGGQKVNFLGLSQNKALLLMTDMSEGDWLADEEKFNNEDPLWFSESSHRVSPVFQVQKAREALRKIFEETIQKKDYQIGAMLVMSQGHIINADDMRADWKKLDVQVTRFAAGKPLMLPDITDILKIDSEKEASPEFVEEVSKLAKAS